MAATASVNQVHVWESESGLPIGPPLRTRLGIEQLRFAEGTQIMAGTRSDKIWTWDVAPDATATAELVRLSGLVAGHFIEPDGAIVSLAADDLEQAWFDLHGRQLAVPEQPAVSAHDWHQLRARECELVGDFFAASVHLDPLVAAAPVDLDLRKRRAEAQAALGRWAAAAADLRFLIENRPDDNDLRTSLAVLVARLGDGNSYRQACAALIDPLLATSSRRSDGRRRRFPPSSPPPSHQRNLAVSRLCKTTSSLRRRHFTAITRS